MQINIFVIYFNAKDIFPSCYKLLSNQLNSPSRFKHMSVRVNAETLAFHGSARSESIKADNKLQLLCDTQQSVADKKFFLDLATNTFDYLGSIASFLVISVPIFAGKKIFENNMRESSLLSVNFLNLLVRRRFFNGLVEN